MATKANPVRRITNDQLGRERRSHLKDRINQVRDYRMDGRKDTPAVAKARAFVWQFDDETNVINRRKCKEARAAKNKAHGELLTTDNFDEGLAIVKKFEALAKQKGWLPSDNED